MIATKYFKFVFLISAIFFPAFSFALAHQPEITESRLTEVLAPEISKAYYGELKGEPDVYVIKIDKSFDLYVNVLVPDITNQKRDVSAVVIKNSNADQPLAVLDGSNFIWTKFYEPFGADTNWRGPEYKARGDAGTYEIRVWSSNNDSKYSLAIGEIKSFGISEVVSTLNTVPNLKKNFFNESPISFIASPIGIGFIIVIIDVQKTAYKKGVRDGYHRGRSIKGQE